MLGSVLCGCAAQQRAVWSKPGATAAELERSKAQCIAAAYREFPPAPTTQPSRPAPNGYTTNCYGDARYTECSTRAQGPLVSVDPFANRGDPQLEKARAASTLSCMYSLGWTVTHVPRK